MWWCTTYVAKSLWRRELVFSRWVLVQDIRDGVLRRLLEWRVAIDHDRSIKPGGHGRGLERRLPADIWTDLASTYVGPAIKEHWAALFRTIRLFRRVAGR